MRKKGFDKLNDRQLAEIQLSYLSGEKSLRPLGEIYGVSHETIRKAIKQDCVTKDQTAVHRLITEHFEAFLDLVERGVSPSIAAGTFGVGMLAYNDLVLKNSDIMEAVHARRCASIAPAEMCLASASGENWKAALSRLQSIGETRTLYKTEEQKGGAPTINLSMSWSRDEDVAITIDNEDVT
mgnify:FL=1